jgi:hypothetical protein
LAPERADEFGGRAQTSLAPAQIHDPGDHHQLQGGEDREVGERDRLRADRGANCARRFDENVCDLALGFPVARKCVQFRPGTHSVIFSPERKRTDVTLPGRPRRVLIRRKIQTTPDATVQLGLDSFRPIHPDRFPIVARIWSRLEVNCYNAGFFAHGIVPMHAFNAVFGASFHLGAAFGGVAQDDDRVADSRSSSRRIVFSALSSAPRASSTEIGAAIFDLNVLPTKNLEDDLAGIFNRDTVKKKAYNLRHGPAPRPGEEETRRGVVAKKVPSTALIRAIPVFGLPPVVFRATPRDARRCGAMRTDSPQQ